MSGNGRDLKNIQKYVELQGIKYKNIVDPEQAHGDNVVVVASNDSETIIDVKNCDGLITKDVGLVLTVITADCAPIIYSDNKKNIVGISHNGRKGTEQRLVAKMIKKFHVLGSKFQDLRVAIGPSIGSCCYPMDLVKENVEQLIESGLKKDQIDFFPFCTKCDSERFFSYRNSRGAQHFPEQFTFVVNTR